MPPYQGDSSGGLATSQMGQFPTIGQYQPQPAAMGAPQQQQWQPAPQQQQQYGAPQQPAGLIL